MTVFLVALLALALYRVGAAPEIEIHSARPAIGKRTAIAVRLRASGRGLGSVRVELVQGDRVLLLAERRRRPQSFWWFWGARTPSEEIRFDVGRETVPGLLAAPATLRVTAERAGTWLRHPAPAVKEMTLPVRLSAPTLQVLSNQTYVAQGGCEAVLYRASETAVRDGVRIGDWFFPGYPLPGAGKLDHFALFAVPYDVADPSGARLVAEDDAGNEAQAGGFITQFARQPVRTDVIALQDDFLKRAVPEILSQTPGFKDRGSLLENYLAINRDLRRQNASTLKELSERSRSEFLWRQPFLPFPNGKVMSHFADRRSYVYNGRVIDHQDHLGFDLASVRHTPVPAANSGIVVLARYFGIYGNAVVIDHGYGLQSLYAHLSEITVGDGQTVARGQEVGRSGATGLAGGDHLHFTMLLAGLPVTPVEWWDPHWIRDRLVAKLGPALPFRG